MDEGPDPYRSAELWDDIRKGKVECEPDLKEAVTGSILNYSTEKEGKEYRWTKIHPLQMIEEIITDLLTNINRKETHTHQEMTEAELDFHRALRIRFIRIRRAVKNILEEQEHEE